MYRPSLRFFLCLALVLVVPSLAWRAEASGAALQFVPSDSMAVVAVDFDKLRTTVVHRTIEASLKKDKGAIKNLNELKKETGLDVFKHIHALTVVLADGALDNDHVAVVLEADIDEARLVKFIEKKEGKSLPKKQGPFGAYYEVDGGKAAFALRGKHLVFGGMAVLPKVLGKNDPNQVFAKLRPGVDKEMIWLAGRTNVAARKELGTLDPNAGKLETLAAGLSIPDGAMLRATAHFSDAAAADTLSKIMSKGLGELANDNSVKTMGLADLVNKITVTSKGADIHIAIDLAKAQVEKIAKAIEGLLKI